MDVSLESFSFLTRVLFGEISSNRLNTSLSITSNSLDSLFIKSFLIITSLTSLISSIDSFKNLDLSEAPFDSIFFLLII